jgi:hypothetical protein
MKDRLVASATGLPSRDDDVVQPGNVRRRGHSSRLCRCPRRFRHMSDERGFEYARPGPELADGQRRHRLKRLDVPPEPVGVESTVAMSNQVVGHRLQPARPAPRHMR